MTNDIDPAKFVPGEMTVPENIFIFDDTAEGLFVLGAFSVGFGVPFYFGNAAIVGLAGGALCGFLGLTATFVSPNHVHTHEWAHALARWPLLPDCLPRHAASDGERDTEETLPTTLLSIGPDAQDLTGVERIHCGARTVEMDDGTVYAGVRVEPTNMSLATEADWERAADGFEVYVDDVVEYPVFLYVTTTEADLGDHLDHYRDRHDDPDIRSNPVLRAINEDFIESYGAYLAGAGAAFQREFYLFCPVDEKEVHTVGTEGRIIEQIVDLPYIGDYLATAVSAVEGEDKQTIRRKQIEIAVDRARTAANPRSGLQAVDGLSVEVTSAYEVASLLRRFWNSEDWHPTDPPVTPGGAFTFNTDEGDNSGPADPTDHEPLIEGGNTTREVRQT